MGRILLIVGLPTVLLVALSVWLSMWCRRRYEGLAPSVRSTEVDEVEDASSTLIVAEGIPVKATLAARLADAMARDLPLVAMQQDARA